MRSGKDPSVQKTYDKWIRIAWIVTIPALAGLSWIILLSLTGGDWKRQSIVLLASCFVLFFSVFLLPMLYYYRKKYSKSDNELLGGKHLAHWTYEQDEWERFVREEWKRARKKALAYPFGIIFAVPILGYFFKGWGVDEVKMIMPWIAGLAVFAGLVLLTAGWRKYQRGVQNVGETFVGEDAVMFNGTYYPWVGFGIKLGKVELLKGEPSVLQFEIRSLGRYGNNSSEVRIPVPRRHEGEAEKIARRLSS